MDMVGSNKLHVRAEVKAAYQLHIMHKEARRAQPNGNGRDEQGGMMLVRRGCQSGGKQLLVMTKRKDGAEQQRDLVQQTRLIQEDLAKLNALLACSPVVEKENSS
eukprot:766618-Hanusia_phi.AAC.5